MSSSARWMPAGLLSARRARSSRGVKRGSTTRAGATSERAYGRNRGRAWPTKGCGAPPDVVSVDLIALAELELEGRLLELRRRHQALVGEQRLEGDEPDLVVDEGAAPSLGGGDLCDQRRAELVPVVQPLLVQRHG